MGKATSAGLGSRKGQAVGLACGIPTTRDGASPKLAVALVGRAGEGMGAESGKWAWQAQEMALTSE